MSDTNLNLVAGGKYLNYFTQDGYEFVSRKDRPFLSGNTKPDAVMIIPYLAEEAKFVMLEEFRPTIGQRVLAFPAGIIDEGETIEEAASRELMEETNLHMVFASVITDTGFSSPGMSDEQNAVVACVCIGTPKAEDGQVIKLIGVDELMDVVTQHSSVSAKVASFAWGLYLGRKMGI